MAAQEDNLFALLGEEEFDVSNLIERIKKEKDEIKEKRKEKVPKEKNQHVIEVEARPLDMRAKRIILPKHVMRSFTVLDKKKQREEEEARAKASAAAAAAGSEAKSASTEVSAAAAGGSEAKSASTEVSAAAASGLEAKSSESNNRDLQGVYRSNYRAGNGYRRRGPRKNKSNENTNRGKFVMGEDGFMHRARNGSIPTEPLPNNVGNDSVDEKKEAKANDVVEKDSGKSVDGDNKEDMPVTEDKAVENVADAKLEKKETSEEYQRRMEFERRKKEREEEAKLMTLKQYEEKQQPEKAKLAKIAEQRRVDEKAFESMTIVGKKKEDFEKKSENKPKKEDNCTSQKGGQKKISIEENLFRWPSNRSYNNGPNRNRYYQQNGSSTRPFAGRKYDEQNKQQQTVNKVVDEKPNKAPEANQQQQKPDNDRPNGERKDSRLNGGDERNNYRQNHYGQRNNYYQQNGGGAPSRPPRLPNLEDAALFPGLPMKPKTNVEEEGKTNNA